MKANCSICNNEFEYDPYWNDAVFVGGRSKKYICPACMVEGGRKADSVLSRAEHKVFMQMTNRNDIRR